MLDVPTRCSWLSLTLPQLQGLVDVVPGYLTTSIALVTGLFTSCSWLILESHKRIRSDCLYSLINLFLCCSWLYLGGALSSAMTVLLLMRLGSYFLGGRAFVFQAELYVGLLMFIGYVLFDTQASLAHW